MGSCREQDPLVLLYWKRVEQGKFSIPVLINYLTNMEKRLKKKGANRKKESGVSVVM